VRVIPAAALALVAFAAFGAQGDEASEGNRAGARVLLDDIVNDLDRELETPIEPKVRLPLQANLERGVGPYDRTQTFFKLEPVLPVRLIDGWVLVSRTIVRFGYKATPASPTGGAWGLDDVNPTLFVSPKYGNVVRWGIGPDIELPTATAQGIGTGKLSVGPALAIVLRPKPWVFGLIVSNVWSVAGAADRAAVNRLSLQYLLNYNFSSGWVLTSSPTITANWNAKTDQVWQVPVGGGVGRNFRLGWCALQPSVQAYAFAATGSGAPRWQLRVQLTYLIP
jgi:hypothetical protein